MTNQQQVILDYMKNKKMNIYCAIKNTQDYYRCKELVKLKVLKEIGHGMASKDDILFKLIELK